MVTKRRSDKVCLSMVAFVLAMGGSIRVTFAAPQKAEDSAAVPARQTQAPAPTDAAPPPVPTGQTPAQPEAPVVLQSPVGPQPRVYHAAAYSAPPSEPLAIKGLSYAF